MLKGSYKIKKTLLTRKDKNLQREAQFELTFKVKRILMQIVLLVYLFRSSTIQVFSKDTFFRRTCGK